jgi:bleomycin hydrolase
MKKILLFLFTLTGFFASAQLEKTTYQFTTIKNNSAGATEDQCATGTCWSFATISFLESEIIRLGNKPVDLSEMFNVRVNYPKKADSYVRYQGKQQFGPGGLSHDVINVLRDYGIVPEASFSGLPAGQKEYDHAALDAILENILKTVLDKNLQAEGPEWKKSIDAVLDNYVGKMPANFDYEGKSYTPASFRDAMKLNANDYVNITSFSHHPFYQDFVLEVPDNWAKGSFKNVPLEEFQQILDNAIDKGFTICWDADVSEKGFSFKNGVGILPDDNVAKEELFTKIVQEKKVTQENRQAEFDKQKTTDDHLMHIVGKAKDQNGNLYYLVKNSWGAGNLYNGYQYVSLNYILMKTVSIVLHKDGIPQALKSKIGVN